MNPMLLTLALCCLVVSFPACPSGTGSDDGVTRDGGRAVDAGGRLDSGMTIDSGVVTAVDAGSSRTPDAGATLVDAGSSTTPDAGAIRGDAGSQEVDAGSGRERNVIARGAVAELTVFVGAPPFRA